MGWENVERLRVRYRSSERRRRRVRLRSMCRNFCDGSVTLCGTYSVRTWCCWREAGLTNSVQRRDCVADEESMLDAMLRYPTVQSGCRHLHLQCSVWQSTVQLLALDHLGSISNCPFPFALPSLPPPFPSPVVVVSAPSTSRGHGPVPQWAEVQECNGVSDRPAEGEWT